MTESNSKWNNLRRYRTVVGIFAVAALLLLCCTADEITQSGNETSRLALVEVLGDHGIFTIDNSLFATVDKGRIDGNFYSDKPMLYSLYLTGIYAIGSWFGMTFAAAAHDVIFTLNFFGSTLFAFLIMFLLYRQLRRLDHGGRSLAALLSFAGIFSTWIFSYGGIINNHVPAAFFLLLTYLLLERQRYDDVPWLPPVAGLCAGVLCCLEIPTGFFFTLASLGYLLWEKQPGRGPRLAGFILGWAILPGLMALVSLMAYGSPLPVYLVAGAYDFPGNIHSGGMAGIQRPESLWRYWYEMLIGGRGLFSYMPALLLIVPALRRRRQLQKECGWCFFAAAAAACVIFYGTMTGDYGGWAYGFRFLIPIIPLLWLWIAEWMMGAITGFWRFFFVLFTVIGIITSAVGAYNPWPACSPKQPGLFNTFEVNCYCAAYEYAPQSIWFRMAERLTDRTQREAYLPRAFSNMNKQVNNQSKSWPVAWNHRQTVAHRIVSSLLPVWKRILTPLCGAVFAWFVLLSAARLAPWLLGRQRLWLSPVEAVTLLAPPSLLLVILIVLGCKWCGVGIAGWVMMTASILLYLLLRVVLEPYRIVLRPVQWHTWSPLLWLAALPLTIVFLLLAVSLQTPPWSWDVLTYQLYIPLRWIQEQAFITVPTVFGDNAAAYAPRNWFVLAAACLQLLPGDSVMEIATITFLALAAAAAALLVRECGGGNTAAQAAGGMVFLSPLFVEYGMLEQPDLAATALLAAALFWMLRAEARQNRGLALLAALCCGLAVGLKTVMLPLAAVPMAVILVREWKRRKWLTVFGVIGMFLIAGGGWYLYNWYCYGNPLFPLNVKLGNWTVWAGAYGPEAVRAGEFHASGLGMLATRVWKDYGGIMTILMVAGWLGWVVLAWRSPVQRSRCRLIGLHAGLWLIMYIGLIPHNLQTRFLFPSLLLALCGLVLAVEKLGRRWTYLPVALTGLAGIVFCAQRIALLSSGNVAAACFHVLLLGLAALALIAAWQVRRENWRWWLLGIMIGLLLIVLTNADAWSKQQRGIFYQRLTGWEWVKQFNRPDDRQSHAVAYTGFNRPYLLAGADLLNRVVYVNVQSGVNDDFYRFWKEFPRVYDFYKPGLYRDRPDYPAWRRNLEQKHIEFLVITHLSPVERSYLAGDADGWPQPEIDWIAAHPAHFSLEASSPAGRVYRLHNL